MGFNSGFKGLIAFECVDSLRSTYYRKRLRPYTLRTVSNGRFITVTK